MKLSKKQEAFIDEYFLNGFNGTAAYKKIYKSSDAVANASAARMLAKDSVKNFVDKRHQELQKAHIVTREELLKDLADIKNDNKKAFPPSALKAIEMLTKMQGWNEPEKVEHSGNVGLDINIIINKPKDGKEPD